MYAHTLACTYTCTHAYVDAYTYVHTHACMHHLGYRSLRLLPVQHPHRLLGPLPTKVNHPPSRADLVRQPALRCRHRASEAFSTGFALVLVLLAAHNPPTGEGDEQPQVPALNPPVDRRLALWPFRHLPPPIHHVCLLAGGAIDQQRACRRPVSHPCRSHLEAQSMQDTHA